jgi:hypothetical protein
MFKLFDTDNSLTLDEFELVEILESQYIAPLLHKWTRTLTWEHFLQRIAMRGLGFGVSRQQAHRQIFAEVKSKRLYTLYVPER